MKKFFMILAVAAMFLTLTALVLSRTNIPGKKNTASLTSNAIPEDLQVVFKNSCMDCHATGGKGMAMAKLNCSGWDEYSSNKQAKKAIAICKIISEGTMPPKTYVEKKSGAILTASQKETICKWSESLVTEK
jgi:cytochrome c5